MSDYTTPQDGKAMSPASTGSVEPVAWAALREDNDIAWIGYTPEAASDGAGGRRIVPLYRSPTLTGAERAVLEWAKEVAESLAECEATGTGGRESHEAATLRGLLERLK